MQTGYAHKDDYLLDCPSLVSELSAESDLLHKTEFSRRTNLRDGSLGNRITLLADEAHSGGTSGRLYVELLTRALALRFLVLASDTSDFKLVRRSKLPTFALSRVLERMELEATEDLDLHTLARESGYSKSQFLRMILRQYGMFPAPMADTASHRAGKTNAATRFSCLRIFEPCSPVQKFP